MTSFNQFWIKKCIKSMNANSSFFTALGNHMEICVHDLVVKPCLRSQRYDVSSSYPTNRKLHEKLVRCTMTQGLVNLKMGNIHAGLYRDVEYIATVNDYDCNTHAE